MSVMTCYLRILTLSLLLLSGCLLGQSHLLAGDENPDSADADELASEDGDGTAIRDAGLTALLRVEGVIDRRQLRYVRRALKEATEAKVDTIITHISSPGGELGAAIALLEEVINVSEDGGPRMIAWIDSSAYSAAAMLAYGHHEIWMRPSAIVGNIGIIFQGPDGEIRYAPEKIETALRTILRSTAETRGWNKALLVKMTARNQELYEARFADGRRAMVIEDDKGTFLADNPDIDPEDPQQWVLVAGEDRLITFTGSEALKRQMATGLVATLPELYMRLGIADDTVLDLAPTPLEMTARTLGSFAPIFISLALLFIFFEFKTPGVGLFAILALVCGSIFFIMQYYQDLVGNWEIVLVALGLTLVMIEIFTMFGGGMLAIVGGIMALIGILGAFLPTDMNWDFSNTVTRDAMLSGLTNLGIVIVLTLVGIISIIAVAPRLPYIDRIAVGDIIGGTSADTPSAPAATSTFGVVDAELRPSGTVLIDGQVHSARAQHGAFIATGTPITVVGHEFGELVVAPSPKDNAPS